MRSTTKRSGIKSKTNAVCQPRSRYGVRLALVRAFIDGDGVTGHAPEKAREEAAGVMRILDQLGVQFGKRGRA